MRKTRLRWLPSLALLASVAALIAMVAGCGKQSSLVTSPDTGAGDVSTGLALKVSPFELHRAIQSQESHTPALLAMSGVVGTAITADANGKPAIMILTESAMGSRLPQTLDGYPVIENVTGKIHAYRSTGGTSHTAKQTPPIQLGTSGGNVNDIANGFCCSGTLGSLVTKGGTQYILSNSHVFDGDVVTGGNGRVSQIGDQVNQPGLVDNNCSASNTNIVATVASLSTIYPPNSTPNVDCAIAQVQPGMVATNGSILEIGTLSASTVAASVGQAVKKSGRTTGLTRGTISALNATVSVGYEDECNGNSFTKTYTGQIIVSQHHSSFLGSGDSGSLMVEDVTTNPRAVGLLFAGSSTSAVANPIGPVLAQLGVTMVGQ